MRLCLAIVVFLCGSLGLARAQSSADKAAADALFDEGKKLVAKGDFVGACQKFEASLEEAVQLGTKIALASCYEKIGRTASAWAEFRGASSLAAKQNDKRQKFAEEHAAALEARLSRLNVVAPAAVRVEGFEVKRDGSPLHAASLGTPVPVDPGEHTLSAEAPGYVTWSIKVTIPAVAGSLTAVEVPALEKLPEPKVVEPPHVAIGPAPLLDADPGRGRRLVAWGVGGAGLALVGTSLIFGGLASSKWSDAKAHCTNNVCDQTGFDLAGSAQSMGNVSTVTFIVGVAAVGAGVVLLLTAPSGETRAAGPAPAAAALRVTPIVGPATYGLSLQGGF